MKFLILKVVFVCAITNVWAEKPSDFSGAGAKRIEEFILDYPTPPPIWKKSLTKDEHQTTTSETPKINEEHTDDNSTLTTNAPELSLADRFSTNTIEEEQKPIFNEVVLADIADNVGLDVLDRVLGTIVSLVGSGLLDESSIKGPMDSVVMRLVFNFIGKVLVDEPTLDLLNNTTFENAKSRFSRDLNSLLNDKNVKITPFTICHDDFQEFFSTIPTNENVIQDQNRILLKILKGLLDLEKTPSLLDAGWNEEAAKECVFYKSVFQTLLFAEKQIPTSSIFSAPKDSQRPLPLTAQSSSLTPEEMKLLEDYKQGVSPTFSNKPTEDLRSFSRFLPILDEVDKKDLATQKNKRELEQMISDNLSKEMEKNPIQEQNKMEVIQTSMPDGEKIDMKTDMPIKEEQKFMMPEEEMVHEEGPSSTPESTETRKLNDEISSKQDSPTEDLALTVDIRHGSLTDNTDLETRSLKVLYPGRYPSRINPENPFLKPNFNLENVQATDTSTSYDINPNNPFLNHNEDPQKLLETFFSTGRSDQSSGISSSMKDRFDTFSKFVAVTSPKLNIQKILNVIPGECRIEFYDVFDKCEKRLNDLVDILNLFRSVLTNFRL